MPAPMTDSSKVRKRSRGKRRAGVAVTMTGLS
jgi:hypothetical protein